MYNRNVGSTVYNNDTIVRDVHMLITSINEIITYKLKYLMESFLCYVSNCLHNMLKRYFKA